MLLEVAGGIVLAVVLFLGIRLLLFAVIPAIGEWWDTVSHRHY